MNPPNELRLHINRHLLPLDLYRIALIVGPHMHSILPQERHTEQQLLRIVVGIDMRIIATHLDILPTRLLDYMRHVEAA